MTSWSEGDAQAQLDTVLDNAESEGPQKVTRGASVLHHDPKGLECPRSTFSFEEGRGRT